MPVMTACALVCMIVHLAAAAEVTPVPAAPGGREAPGTHSEAGERAGSGTTPAEKKAETIAPGQGLTPAAGETRPEERKPEPVEPLFVRPLSAIESGRNDSNPVWSPLGTLLAFERSTGDKKEIQIALSDGTVFQTVYYQLSDGAGKEMKFFFPGVVEEVSYNAGITWAPEENRFVFMSNGGEGNYDLYLADLGGKDVTRLTTHKEKDGQPDWSPRGNNVIFTSGRTGKGDIYSIDVATKALTRLTRGNREYLYPQWSPDGKRIVLISGSNENHDIYLITDVVRPQESLVALSGWSHDDIRPVWSPDGKKIAFYSNYNEAEDPRAWCIIVVAADGSDPVRGKELAAKVVATEVIPDVERGPAWLPDSSRIIFVKDDRHAYNPLYLADLRSGTTVPIRTDTKMNHDVACSPRGTVAFRAQVDQWDQIYLMKLKD